MYVYLPYGILFDIIDYATVALVPYPTAAVKKDKGSAGGYAHIILQQRVHHKIDHSPYIVDSLNSLTRCF